MSIQNPYQPALDAPVDPFLSVDHDYGGIGRAQYFLGSIGIGVVQNVFNAVVAPRMPETSSAVLVLLIAALAASGAVALSSYRMINQGASGWWGVASLIPLLNLYVGLRCLICPEGYSDHKTLDGTGKVLGGIFLGLTVLVVVMAVIAAYA